MKKIVILLFLASIFSSCGDGSTTQDDSNAGKCENSATQVCESITTDGGTVTLLDGTTGLAAVTLPKDAVNSETKIGINQLKSAGYPDSDKLGSAVYDFAPNGQDFSQPVNIAITLTKNVPANHTVAIALLVD
ncbi:hypothetical protein KAH37_00180, partial [bacterium]|nr:hypothetical protein [bacterium]